MSNVQLGRRPKIAAFCYTKQQVGRQDILSGLTTWSDELRWYFHNHISYSAADNFSTLTDVRSDHGNFQQSAP